MKIAMCIGGLPRFIKESHSLFSKYLVGFEDMDIFVHSWSESENDNPENIDLKQGTTGNSENKTRLETVNMISDVYKPTGYLYEPQKWDLSPNGIKAEEFVHWSMFYSICRANEIKKQYELENNISYDCVIRTRFDCGLLEKLDVLEHIDKFECTVLAPWIHRHGTSDESLMDWFNFSSSEVMNTHAQVWKHMPTYKDEAVRMTSGEVLLMHHLKSNDLVFHSVAVKCKLIRLSANADTWISYDKLPL